MIRYTLRTLWLITATGLAALALTAATAQADPFSCDRVGPSISSSTECGSTGVCYWEYLGNGLWLEHCYHYCDIHWCS